MSEAPIRLFIFGLGFTASIFADSMRGRAACDRRHGALAGEGGGARRARISRRSPLTARRRRGRPSRAPRGDPSSRLDSAWRDWRPGARPSRRRHRRSARTPLDRVPVDGRRLWRRRRRLGRRGDDAPPAAGPDDRARRHRGRLGRARTVARPSRRHLPARRHLRARPQRLRQSRGGKGAPDRQAGAGLQSHPHRRHRADARGGDRATGGAHLTISPTIFRRRRRTWSPLPRT